VFARIYLDRGFYYIANNGDTLCGVLLIKSILRDSPFGVTVFFRALMAMALEEVKMRPVIVHI